MTNRKEAKKSIWGEPKYEEQNDIILKSFEDKIQRNYNTALKLKEKSESFEPKPNKPLTVPTMKEFLLLSYLHKLDHKESLELHRIVFETFLELDKKLAKTIQYLEDNIQLIAEKSGAELKSMKEDVAVVQKDAIAVLNLIKNQQKQEQEVEEKWREAERTKGYVA